jgi:hypothetical protein
MKRTQVLNKISGVSLLSSEKLNNLEMAINFTRHLSGDMAEFGVYKGGSAYFIHWCCPNKLLHLFDTFAGCPEDDVYDIGHKKGDFISNLGDVKEFLGQGNYVYHVGYFPDTTKGLDKLYSFVHVDCDLKKGIEDSINYFWPRLVTGGIILFDDYGWKKTPGVKEVVDKFFPRSCFIQAAINQVSILKEIKLF